MKILKLASLGLLLSSGTVFAQSPVQPNTSGPPGFPNTTNGASMVGAPKNGEQSTMPTPAQCTAGYQQGMTWTRDEFTRACAQINGAINK